jgi:hypothetical protein
MRICKMDRMELVWGRGGGPVSAYGPIAAAQATGGPSPASTPSNGYSTGQQPTFTISPSVPPSTASAPTFIPSSPTPQTTADTTVPTCPPGTTMTGLTINSGGWNGSGTVGIPPSATLGYTGSSSSVNCAPPPPPPPSVPHSYYDGPGGDAPGYGGGTTANSNSVSNNVG